MTQTAIRATHGGNLPRHVERVTNPPPPRGHLKPGPVCTLNAPQEPGWAANPEPPGPGSPFPSRRSERARPRCPRPAAAPGGAERCPLAPPRGWGRAGAGPAAQALPARGTRTCARSAAAPGKPRPPRSAAADPAP